MGVQVSDLSELPKCELHQCRPHVSCEIRQSKNASYDRPWCEQDASTMKSCTVTNCVATLHLTAHVTITLVQKHLLIEQGVQALPRSVRLQMHPLLPLWSILLQHHTCKLQCLLLQIMKVYTIAYSSPAAQPLALGAEWRIKPSLAAHSSEPQWGESEHLNLSRQPLGLLIHNAVSSMLRSQC